MEQSVHDSDIAKAWAGNTIRVPEAILSKHPLSQDLRSFLAKVGLPRDCPLLVTFYEDAHLLQPLTYERETYLIVGDDSGSKLCIKTGTEDVWSIDPAHQLPRRFINTELRHFVLFLHLYRSRQPGLETASDEQAAAIIAAMRSEFSRLDARSLDDGENWWSVILEQSEQGQL
jgi:hypothetical protein